MAASSTCLIGNGLSIHKSKHRLSKNFSFTKIGLRIHIAKASLDVKKQQQQQGGGGGRRRRDFLKILLDHVYESCLCRVLEYFLCI
ncbi:unnamed protein product [Cochlearia groenlandica]